MLRRRPLNPMGWPAVARESLLVACKHPEVAGYIILCFTVFIILLLCDTPTSFLECVDGRCVLSRRCVADVRMIFFDSAKFYGSTKDVEFKLKDLVDVELQKETEKHTHFFGESVRENWHVVLTIRDHDQKPSTSVTVSPSSGVKAAQFTTPGTGTNNNQASSTMPSNNKNVRLYESVKRPVTIGEPVKDIAYYNYYNNRRGAERLVNLIKLFAGIKPPPVDTNAPNGNGTVNGTMAVLNFHVPEREAVASKLSWVNIAAEILHEMLVDFGTVYPNGSLRRNNGNGFTIWNEYSRMDDVGSMLAAVALVYIVLFCPRSSTWTFDPITYSVTYVTRNFISQKTLVFHESLHLVENVLIDYYTVRTRSSAYKMYFVVLQLCDGRRLTVGEPMIYRDRVEVTRSKIEVFIQQGQDFSFQTFQRTSNDIASDAASSLHRPPALRIVTSNELIEIGLKLPPEFCCPITQQMMGEPVVAADGHTYERSAIESWISQCVAEGKVPLSPFTGLRLGRGNLLPNHALRNAIESFVDSVEHTRRGTMANNSTTATAAVMTVGTATAANTAAAYSITTGAAAAVALLATTTTHSGYQEV